MVKRILIALGIFAFIVLPFFVSAQFPKAEMSDCCKLNHDIEVSSATTYKVFGACVNVGPPLTFLENCIVSERASGAGTTCTSKNQTIGPVNISTPDWGGVCTMDTICTVTDFIFWAFLAIVVIIGVYAGFMFMTAGGDPGKIEKAKSMITYLVIGIVVAIAVKLIPALARAIIGV